MRRIACVVAIAALLGAAPGAHAAGEVSAPAPNTLRFTGDAGVRDLLNVIQEGANVRFSWQPSASGTPPTRATAPGCVVSAGDDVVCPLPGGPGARIELLMGDGNDVVNYSVPAPVSVPLTIRGGPGSDSLDGASGGDEIHGDEGADFLEGHLGADMLHGESGFDRASFSDGGTAFHVSLDGVANDGRNGGAEGDNVLTDVEDVDTGAGNDVIVGSDAGNILFSGAGNDEVDGKGGVDIYELGAGDDKARTRDGIGERILCGEGDDHVVSDDVDDLGGCETDDPSGELVRDLDKDGFAKPADCNDADPAVNPSAADVPDNGRDENCDGNDATVPDADGDGVPKPYDCDDRNPAVKPGAEEVYGNDVDEDCNRRNDPLRTLRAPFRLRFVPKGAIIKVTALRVGRLEAGTRVVALCTGNGCPRGLKRTFETVLTRNTSGVDLRKRLRIRSVRAGAKIQIRVLRKDSIGSVRRLTFKRRTVPRIEALCMKPSDSLPRRCS